MSTPLRLEGKIYRIDFSRLSSCKQANENARKCDEEP